MDRWVDGWMDGSSSLSPKAHALYFQHASSFSIPVYTYHVQAMALGTGEDRGSVCPTAMFLTR